MTTITCVEIGSNYPENIKIDTAVNENGKAAGFLYRLKDGEIHKTMLSSDFVFETEEEANTYFHDTAKWCVQWVKDNEVFG